MKTRERYYFTVTRMTKMKRTDKKFDIEYPEL